MTAEYRQRYPTKPVICDFPQGAWAYLCAGGSMPNLPRTTDSRLLAAIPGMQPCPEACNENQWVLRETGHQYLIYCASGSPQGLGDFQQKNLLVLRTVDSKTGLVTEKETRFSWAQFAELRRTEHSPAIYWLIQNRDE